MSLKTAFASVLKTMRSSRGLTQEHLLDATSRTYLSKLERAQSSPTLNKLDAISQTLELSPLALIALTHSTESHTPLREMLNRLETELLDLRHAGVLKKLEIDFDAVTKAPRLAARPLPEKGSLSSSQQTELHFTD